MNTVEKLEAIQNAISQLDLRGDDESVNNALAIVWSAIMKEKKGESFTAFDILADGLQARKDEFIG